jgi:hypothetical protein
VFSLHTSLGRAVRWRLWTSKYTSSYRGFLRIRRSTARSLQCMHCCYVVRKFCVGNVCYIIQLWCVNITGLYQLLCPGWQRERENSRNSVIPMLRCADHSGRAVWRELPSFARTLESWIRIQLEAWMSVCVYCVFVLGSDLAMGWSVVQGVLPNVLR